MDIALVPQPASCQPRQGAGCRLDAGVPIVATAGTRPEAEVLAAQLVRVFGRAPAVLDEGAPGTLAIRLERAEGLGDEGYRLEVGAGGVVIAGERGAGIFHSTQTLLQLLPPTAPGGADIPALAIADRPRFAWRGAMLDPSRHFIPLDDVLRFIDLIARHHLNRLHLHLSDDQGWRIEIRRYPRLTTVGAWRRETIACHGHLKERRYDGVPHGGFYSQDDIRRIVAHAAARHITVVPEIDLPGHMQAAIAAYPWLGNSGEPCEVLPHWGINPRILNAEERTLRFCEDVLAEVVELFPSPWIHVGGDEAVKDEWKASPRIQERIRELGAGDEHGLQSHIIKRMDAFLTARGRRLVGWDEILEGGLAPNATVMSWRGFQGGIDAARQGRDVVMAPTSHTYLDNYQCPDAGFEPIAIGGLITLEKAYAFEPIPPELTPEEAKRVLGGQGQLWSEYIPDRAVHDLRAWPRLCALAEVLWSPRELRDWAGFQRRMAVHGRRLDALGVGRFREPRPGQVPAQPAARTPALVVLAAGMGSRFGGDKQVAQVGPHDETILDYTAFDARRWGFGEVVLVVRREMQATVAAMVGDRLARRMPVRYVFQDMHEPLPGLPTPGRSKPWGTAHALACALRGLSVPCGVVNADDWYAPGGIRALANQLARADTEGCLVAYPLARTLSPNGAVNRAVCSSNRWGGLESIAETTGIAAAPGGGIVDGQGRPLAPETPVSLNLWGLQPAAYAGFLADVDAFIRAHAGESAGECQLPDLVMAGMRARRWSVRVVQADADWCGLTYQADRPAVQARLARAVAEGDYPAPLW